MVGTLYTGIKVAVGTVVGGNEVKVGVTAGVAVSALVGVTGVAVGAFRVSWATAVCTAWVLTAAKVEAISSVGAAVGVDTDEVAALELQPPRKAITMAIIKNLYSAGLVFISILHFNWLHLN
jgi:hypothetical protein